MSKKSPKLTILVGCPASGKSTYAEWLVRTEPKTIRVSRDEIRFAQFQESLEQNVEAMVSKLVYAQVKTALENHWDVVLDNCHVKYEYIKEAVKEYQHLAHIEFKLFDLALEELIERNEKRNRKVPLKVIQGMFEQLQDLKTKFDFARIKRVERSQWIDMQVATPEKPACILVDIDGTLSNSEQRDIFMFQAEEIYTDRVIEQVAYFVRKMNEDNVKVVFCSGREDRFREITEKWLKEKCKLDYDALFMRKTGDFRNDALVKEDMLKEQILPKYTPLFAIDDRKRVKQMWVKNGVFVFDVNQHDLIF